MVVRRKPKWRRKGESLSKFEARQRRYTDRVIGDMVYKTHIKSPEYPNKTLCGLLLRHVGRYTTKAKEVTCKRCKEILKTYK